MRRRAVPRARRATCRKARSRWRFERLRAARHRAPTRSPQTLAHAYISPVLTAHPTEVQRKSILDAERAIAELLAARDARARARASCADNEALMRARVTQLWQTRMLRYAKLTVADEIENALSYYRATFLRADPELYREIEEALPGHDDRAASSAWATGSAATATATRTSTPRRCDIALRAPERDGAAPLPDRGARARRRAVDLGDAGAGDAGDAGAGRRARPTPTRTARTSPTGAR